MNLSTLFAALAALPLDHKRACAISLESFIKRDEIQEEIARRELETPDQLLEVLASDGGVPIAPKVNHGRPINPRSKAQRVRSLIREFLEMHDGSAMTIDVKHYIYSKDHDLREGDIYNSAKRMTEIGELIRENGMWKLTSGIKEDRKSA